VGSPAGLPAVTRLKNYRLGVVREPLAARSLRAELHQPGERESADQGEPGTRFRREIRLARCTKPELGSLRRCDSAAVEITGVTESPIGVFRAHRKQTAVAAQLTDAGGTFGDQFGVSVAVSGDGKSVYVAATSSPTNSAVARLNRNLTTGALTQPAGTPGCVSETGAGPCAHGHALKGASGVAVSPDGNSVYVASFNSNAAARLNRAP